MSRPNKFVNHGHFIPMFYLFQDSSDYVFNSLYIYYEREGLISYLITGNLYSKYGIMCSEIKLCNLVESLLGIKITQYFTL